MGIAPGSARAELVWEPVGPVPTSAGMTAIATDPADPAILWIASASSVWVSDDGGDSFSLVLQLSRANAIARETGSGEQAEADADSATDPGAETTDDGDPINPDTGEPYDPDDPDAVDASDDIDPMTGLPIPEVSGTTTATEDDAPVDDNEDTDDIDASGDANARFGVTRLRVIGDKVYVCTGRGLWTVDRAARRPGTGQDVRFGRRVAVNDVLRDARDRLLLATDRGVLVLGPDGLSHRLVGGDDEIATVALALVGARTVIAAVDGLRMEVSGTIVPLGLSIGRGTANDVVALGPDRFVVASSDHVSLVMAEEGKAAFIEQSWQVPGAYRLAVGRDNTLFAAGWRSVWQYDETDGWRRRDEGLLDRRLSGVAPSASGPNFLYLVGRGGTARLVPEQEKLWSSRARFQARRALEGLPTADETVAWAQATRPIQVSDAKGWQTERSLAWLLPRVYLRYLTAQRRQEEFLFIPAVGRRILDAVEVFPTNDEFRIEARWDIMPALMLAAEGTDPTIRAAETAALKGQAKVRDTVGPLYQAWMKKRIDLVASTYHDVGEAARELLAVQQIEADLFVYTGGRFPIAGVTTSPADASSSSESSPEPSR